MSNKVSLWFGLAELLRSPSGVFGLLTLIALSVITWHAPAIGSAALAAFCAVVPTIIVFCENREALASMTPAQIASLPSTVPSPIVTTTTTVQPSDLPPNGQL